MKLIIVKAISILRVQANYLGRAKGVEAILMQHQFQCNANCRMTSIRNYSIQRPIGILDRSSHDTFVAPIECQRFGHWIKCATTLKIYNLIIGQVQKKTKKQEGFRIRSTFRNTQRLVLCKLLIIIRSNFNQKYNEAVLIFFNL